jgi:nitrate reductase (cytochrome), electron transfer subunit
VRPGRGGAAAAAGVVFVIVAAAALAAAGRDAAAVADDLDGAGTVAPRVREPLPPPAGAASPIAAEAGVYRLPTEGLAVGPGTPRRGDAHPRTLATFRSLRAHPGAPPRIPHGLTPAEHLGTGCNACHERGGFSDRFSAYVPVTPHPELADCLACHLPDAALVGLPLPGYASDPDARCRQCHTPAAGPAPRDAAARSPWPAPRGVRELPGAPPEIPHDLHFRENCVPCHAGPGAVAEIRTPHADRPDCRQCHLRAAAPAAARVAASPDPERSR